MLLVMPTKNAPLLRQHPEYMQNVVELSLRFLSLYDEDADFESVEDDADQLFVDNARHWTRELALKLGGGPFLAVAQPLLQSGIRGTNWKQQYAALQALCQIMPSIKEVDGWSLPPHDGDGDEEADDGGDGDDDESEHKMDGGRPPKCVWDVLAPQIMALTVTETVRPEIKHSALQCLRALIVENEDNFQRFVCSLSFSLDVE